MEKPLKLFEKVIVASLVIMMAAVVALATFELGWLIVVDVMTPPIFLLEINELLDIFGLFLLILVGIELLDTIKSYLEERRLHVEIVLMVAMIALARKIIIVDETQVTSGTLLGFAGMIAALAIGYYLIKWRDQTAKRARSAEP